MVNTQKVTARFRVDGKTPEEFMAGVAPEDREKALEALRAAQLGAAWRGLTSMATVLHRDIGLPWDDVADMIFALASDIDGRGAVEAQPNFRDTFP